MSTRREFLSDICKLCAFAGIAGISATMLESCKTIQYVMATDDGNNPKVPVSSFGESTQIIVQSKRMTDYILVHRRADSSYGAVLMKCTHQNQPLTASGNSLYCSSHGSKFDLDGNVVLAPATRPLTSFPVTVSGTELIIEIKNN